MTWKQISSKSVYKNKWMEVTEDQVETDLGKKLTFGVVRKKPFALITPWDGKHLFLVGQYRYPIDEFSWEFPQGHFEHNTILETANHELKEETGIIAGHVEEVAVINIAPGHHSQRCHVFMATELTEGERETEYSEEGMKVKKVTFSELQQMISEGIIKDSPTIAVFGLIIAKHLIDVVGNLSKPVQLGKPNTE